MANSPPLIPHSEITAVPGLNKDKVGMEKQLDSEFLGGLQKYCPLSSSHMHTFILSVTTQPHALHGPSL